MEGKIGNRNFNRYQVTPSDGMVLRGDHQCPYHFARIFPVVFQNLRSPSQTVDRDGVPHQQDRPFGRQLHMQPGTP